MPKFCCSVVVLWCCFFTGATKQSKNPALMYCAPAMATATRTARKAIGLDQQKKVFHVHHPFVYIFFLQTALFHILLWTWTQSNYFLILFLNFQYNRLELSPRKDHQHLTNWTASFKWDESSLFSMSHSYRSQVFHSEVSDHKLGLRCSWAGDECVLLIEATVGYSIRRIGNCRLRKIVANTEI